MICPTCGRKHKYAAGMQCGCGYHFLFNPKGEEAFTDNRLKNLLVAASANDTAFFTLAQVRTLIVRAGAKKVRTSRWWGGALLVLGIGLGLLVHPIPGLIVAGFGVLSFTLGGASARSTARKRAEVLPSAVKRWQAAGHEVPRLLQAPSLHQPPPEFQEKDLYDYGVERILIVQGDLLVDLLVKNGFHAELRTLVMSETGYPGYLQAHALRIISENPHTPVFLLHDDSIAGHKMRQRLAAGWVAPAAARAVDLGYAAGDPARLFPRVARDVDAFDRIEQLPYRILVSLLTVAFARGVTFSTLAAERKSSSADGFIGDSDSMLDFG